MTKSLSILALVALWFGLSGQTCTMKIVYGKDYPTDPKKAYFSTNKQTAISTLKRALEKLGYEISQLDEAQGKVTTGWKPVEGDSHYAILFERKDYGVSDGAYYQLVTDLLEEGSKIKVVVGTNVKSIAGPLKSSGKVEKRVLDQLQDYLRSPQIEMTNVGVENR